MNNLILILLLGCLGGIIGEKLNIPAGSLVGAMILVGIYNVFTSNAVVPKELAFLSQVVIGSAIGLNFTPDIFRLLSKLVIPSLIVVTGLLLMSVVLGLILHKFTGLDIATSLCHEPRGPYIQGSPHRST